jgi:hypothetical protein
MQLLLAVLLIAAAALAYRLSFIVSRRLVTADFRFPDQP